MNEIQLTVAKIRKGLSLYIICSFAAAILGAISVMTSGAAVLGVAAGGSGAGLGFVAILMGIITAVTSLGIIYGLFVWRGGLLNFSTHLDEVGANATRKLATALLLLLINAALGILSIVMPLVLSIPMLIISIAAFILNIMGYSALSGSDSLNELGKAGAKKLFLGFILAIVGAVVAMIPLIGGVLSLVFNILYLVFLFQGWAMIQQSFSTER